MLPGAKSIEDFPDLPNSERSNLPGDTWQAPNLKAFYSDNYRNFVTRYYLEAYKEKSVFPFPPLKLNYPPEYAYTAIKDQTKSTYLEEVTYPFRDSLFVNGLEPFEVDGSPRYPGAVKMGNFGENYSTKVIIRYYSTSLQARISYWLLLNACLVGVFLVSRKVFSHG